MRCIHLHHILGYEGLGQKIVYVFRRLMGKSTPSADMVGCKHNASPSWDWDNDIKLTEQLFLKNGSLIRLMDVGSLYPKEMTDISEPVFDEWLITHIRRDITKELLSAEAAWPQNNIYRKMSGVPVGIIKCTEPECKICEGHEDAMTNHQHFVMDMGDFEYRTQLRDEACQESIDSGVPVELHFHPEGNDCRNAILVCERFNLGISEPIV